MHSFASSAASTGGSAARILPWPHGQLALLDHLGHGSGQRQESQVVCHGGLRHAEGLADVLLASTVGRTAD